MKKAFCDDSEVLEILNNEDYTQTLTDIILNVELKVSRAIEQNKNVPRFGIKIVEKLKKELLTCDVFRKIIKNIIDNGTVDDFADLFIAINEKYEGTYHFFSLFSNEDQTKLSSSFLEGLNHFTQELIKDSLAKENSAFICKTIDSYFEDIISLSARSLIDDLNF